MDVLHRLELIHIHLDSVEVCVYPKGPGEANHGIDVRRFLMPSDSGLTRMWNNREGTPQYHYRDGDNRSPSRSRVQLLLFITHAHSHSNPVHPGFVTVANVRFIFLHVGSTFPYSI